MAKIYSQLEMLLQTLRNDRLSAAKSYLSLEAMQGVGDKLDGLGDRTGKIEALQAGHGATLRAIQEI